MAESRESTSLVELVARLQDEQSRHWNTGQPRRVEDYLAEHPRLREQPQRIVDLIYWEFRLREARGEAPQPQEYYDRFPQLAPQLARQFEVHSQLLGDSAAPHAESTRIQPGQGDGPPPESSGTTMQYGRYVVRREIGRGGFGRVYAAWDPELERDVAIKLLGGASGPDLGFSDLRDEARKVARLSHPAIVPVYDFGEQQGAFYVVSRLITGTSLAQRMKSGRCPLAEAVRIVARIADGLHHAHEAGLVHRDVKPSNILLDGHGRAYLTDFGLALSDAERRGRDGEIAGTLAYMAPEMLEGRIDRIGPASDLFSLGIILYQLLTGELPFPAQTFADKQAQLSACRPRPPRSLDDSIPEPLERLCLWTLARDVGDRPRTARDLAGRLRALRRRAVQPAASPATPHSWPLPPASLTPIIGRDRELDELHRLAAYGAPRLVTILGPGGVGKSRLCSAVGRELQDEIPDGVAFIELSAVTDAAFVLPRIKEALGLESLPGESSIDVLARHIGERQVVLLLDNLEQVVDAGPGLVAVLERCPRLKLVVTSRIALDVRGETIYPLEPLPLLDADVATAEPSSSPAARLFVERAAAIVPGFTLNADNAASVTAICRRLDGLPLAIELAASRLRILSPSELLARLQHRWTVLRGGARDLPARQRTLRDTIAWSYDLLSREGRVILHRLCVLAGRVPLSEVGDFLDRLPGGADDPLEQVEQLARGSLVWIDRSATPYRVSMLESIREFAREQLAASGSESEVLGAWGQWCLDLAEEAKRHRTDQAQAEWTTRLDELADCFSGALQEAASGGLEPELGLKIAAALWWYWELRGRYEEGLHWLRRFLAAAPASAAALRADALNAAGNLARDAARFDEAEQHYKTALDLRRELGDDRGVGIVVQNLGNVALERGDLDEAERLYRESLDIRRRVQDDWGTAMTLNNLAVVQIHRGRFAQTAPLLDEAETLFASQGDGMNVARVRDIRGEAAQGLGDFALAEQAHRAALDVRRQLGHRLGIALSLENLASALIALQRPDEAARCLSEALLVHLELRQPRDQARILCSAALLAVHVQDPDAAARLLGCSQAILPDADSRLDDLGQLTFHDAGPAAAEARAQVARLLEEEQSRPALEAGRASSVLDAVTLIQQLPPRLANRPPVP